MLWDACKVGQGARTDLRPDLGANGTKVKKGQNNRSATLDRLHGQRPFKIASVSDA